MKQIRRAERGSATVTKQRRRKLSRKWSGISALSPAPPGTEATFSPIIHYAISWYVPRHQSTLIADDIEIRIQYWTVYLQTSIILSSQFRNTIFGDNTARLSHPGTPARDKSINKTPWINYSPIRQTPPDLSKHFPTLISPQTHSITKIAQKNILAL